MHAGMTVCRAGMQSVVVDRWSHKGMAQYSGVYIAWFTHTLSLITAWSHSTWWCGG